METSVLTTREVGQVIIGSGSTTSAGEHGFVITTRAEDMAGIETGLLVTSS